MGRECVKEAPGERLPDVHGADAVTRGEQHVVGAEGQCGHPVGVLVEFEDLLARLGGKYPHDAVRPG